LLLIFAFSDCSKQPGSGGLARLKPCRLPGIDEKLLCGQLTVFENRLTRAGRTIDLNVVVLPAFDQRTKAEPLFDLAGGPGAAATEGATISFALASIKRRTFGCGRARSAGAIK